MDLLAPCCSSSIDMNIMRLSVVKDEACRGGMMVCGLNPAVTEGDEASRVVTEFCGAAQPERPDIVAAMASARCMSH